MQAVPTDPGKLTLYAGDWASAGSPGAMKEYGPGAYVLSDFNNQMSSLKITPECTAVIYDAGNFATSTTLISIKAQADINQAGVNSRSFNDKASSLTFACGSPVRKELQVDFDACAEQVSGMHASAQATCPACVGMVAIYAVTQ
jgi:hypothetical protein